MNNLLDNLKVTAQPTENSVKIFGKHYSLPKGMNEEQIKTVLDFVNEHLNLNVKYFSVPTLQHLFTTTANTQKFMALLAMLKSQTQLAFKIVDHGNDDNELIYTGLDFANVKALEIAEPQEKVEEKPVDTGIVADADKITEKLVETKAEEKSTELVEEKSVEQPELIEEKSEPIVEEKSVEETKVETQGSETANVAVIEEDKDNAAKIEEKIGDANIPKIEEQGSKE